MYGQIGSWDEGLVITFDDQALAWLDAQDTDRYVWPFFEVVDGQLHVSVIPGKGPANARRVSNKGRGAHVDYQFAVRWDWKDLKSVTLSRFELVEVKFQPDGEDAESFSFTLPKLHMLPWPKLRKCEAYDLPTQIVKEMEARMKSAKAAFGDLPPAKWTWVPLPERYRDQLARGVYADCLRAVLAGEKYQEREAA